MTEYIYIKSEKIYKIIHEEKVETQAQLVTIQAINRKANRSAANVYLSISKSFTLELQWMSEIHPMEN